MHRVKPAEPGDLRPSLTRDRTPPRQVDIQAALSIRVEGVRVRGCGLGQRPAPGLAPSQLAAGIAQRGDIRGDQDYSEQHAPDVHCRIPADGPGLARLPAAGRDTDLQIHHRLTGGDHTLQQLVHLMADVTQELRHGATDVVRGGTAVQPGQDVVDLQMAPRGVIEGETDRSPGDKRRQ